jgi:hypothetical protein
MAWAASFASHGQDRITWQPQSGLREAAIIEPYGGPQPGSVLAAQSLEGITGQQRSLVWSITYGWLAILSISLLTVRPLPARGRPRRR